MKKCVLFLFLMMTVTSLSAQWKFTPEAGMNFTTYKDGDGSKIGARLGVAVQYQIPSSSIFSIRSGLYFLQRKNEYFAGYTSFYDKVNDTYWSQYIAKGGGDYFSYYYPNSKDGYDFESLSMTESEENRNYLQLPVMAQFTWKICEDVNFYTAIGPYIAYGIGGKTRRDRQIWDKNMDWKTFHTEENTFGDYYLTVEGEEYKVSGQRRFDWGVSALVGIEVKRFNFSLGYDLGYGVPYKGYSFEIGPRYRSGFVSIGYSF